MAYVYGWHIVHIEQRVRSLNHHLSLDHDTGNLENNELKTVSRMANSTKGSIMFTSFSSMITTENTERQDVKMGTKSLLLMKCPHNSFIDRLVV